MASVSIASRAPTNRISASRGKANWNRLRRIGRAVEYRPVAEWPASRVLERASSGAFFIQVHSQTQSPHTNSQKEAGSTPASAMHIASAKATAAMRSSVKEIVLPRGVPEP